MRKDIPAPRAGPNPLWLWQVEEYLNGTHRFRTFLLGCPSRVCCGAGSRSFGPTKHFRRSGGPVGKGAGIVWGRHGEPAMPLINRFTSLAFSICGR
jgi:hypothetical protein